jgi:hypothetical protein
MSLGIEALQPVQTASLAFVMKKNDKITHQNIIAVEGPFMLIS